MEFFSYIAGRSVRYYNRLEEENDILDRSNQSSRRNDFWDIGKSLLNDFCVKFQFSYPLHRKSKVCAVLL